MFENVLGQAACTRLAADLGSASLPPALLFAGPTASGKGTAALELARALSCETGKAAWNCACPSCESHRSLSHPDVLLLGPRAFSSEIAASAAAFLRDPPSTARTLFLRSVRKLLLRFSPVLWEGDETKFAKAAVLYSSLTEDLEELNPQYPLPEGTQLRKLVESMQTSAVKLESEGVADSVPIAQIRRAAYWTRLAPNGRKKLLFIEGADRMQEGSRNALLKILEEPPETAILILSTTRRGALMPTILSRVRPYIFAARNEAVERDVVRRVFRDTDAADALDAQSVAGTHPGAEAHTGTGAVTGSRKSIISEYLDGFLPASPRELEEAAVLFLASTIAAAEYRVGAESLGAARRGPQSGRGSLGGSLSVLATLANGLGTQSASLPREARLAVAALMDGAHKFEPRSLFTSFLERLLTLCSRSLCDLRNEALSLQLAEDWSQAVRAADSAVGTYNQNPLLALERLFGAFADALTSAAQAGKRP